MRILVTPEEYEELKDQENPDSENPKRVIINGIEGIWFTPNKFVLENIEES